MRTKHITIGAMSFVVELPTSSTVLADARRAMRRLKQKPAPVETRLRVNV